MTALAGEFTFSAAALRRRVAAQLSASVLALTLALGSPLCQAAHSVLPVADDGVIGSALRGWAPEPSLSVSEAGETDGACCHLSLAREDATGKSLALPQRGFTSALSTPSPASWAYRIPVAHAVRSMHRIPPLTTPLARFTDKLVL